jgi:hypothetical protein
VIVNKQRSSTAADMDAAIMMGKLPTSKNHQPRKYKVKFSFKLARGQKKMNLVQLKYQ